MNYKEILLNEFKKSNNKYQMYFDLLLKVKDEDIIKSYNKFILNIDVNTKDIILKIKEFINKSENDELNFNYLEKFAGYCGIDEDYDYESFNNRDLLIEFADIVNNLEILIYRNLDKDIYSLALNLLNLKINCKFYDEINYDIIDYDCRNVLDYDEIISTDFFCRLITICIYLTNKCNKVDLDKFIIKYKIYINDKVLNNILIKDYKETIKKLLNNLK